MLKQEHIFLFYQVYMECDKTETILQHYQVLHIISLERFFLRAASINFAATFAPKKIKNSSNLPLVAF